MSVLPVLSKVLEKVLEVQTKKFVTQYLPENQLGFRLGQRWSFAFSNVTDNVFRAFDHGEAAAHILLDCTKSFVSLNHMILFDVLNHVGFSLKIVI